MGREICPSFLVHPAFPLNTLRPKEKLEQLGYPNFYYKNHFVIKNDHILYFQPVDSSISCEPLSSNSWIFLPIC